VERKEQNAEGGTEDWGKKHEKKAGTWNDAERKRYWKTRGKEKFDLLNRRERVRSQKVD